MDEEKKIALRYVKKLERHLLISGILLLISTVLFVVVLFINLENVANFITITFFVNYDNNMKALAQNITKGSCGIESLDRLSGWVYSNIKYVSDDHEKNAIEVFYTRKGVCKDKVKLLLALAKSVGMKGSIMYFDNHVVAVFKDNPVIPNEIVICDPTRGNPYFVRDDYPYKFCFELK